MQGSPLPYLPMKALTSKDLFKIADDPIARVLGSKTVDLYLPGLKGGISYNDGDSINLAIVARGYRFNGLIKVISLPQKFGNRWLFICPCCAQSVSALIAYADRLYCLRGFRKAHIDMSIARRNALILEARDSFKHGRVIPPPTRSDAPKVRRKQVTPPRHWTSTEVALDRGRGMFDHNVTRKYLREDVIPDNVPPFDVTTRPTTVGVIIDYPSFDLRTFVAQSAFVTEQVKARTLHWSNDHGIDEKVLVISDYRGFEPTMAIAHDMGSLEDPKWQFLTLHLQGDGRMRFVCPVLNKNCDVLYLRNGLFASREAQRLIHPSQRAAGRKEWDKAHG